MYVCVCVLCHLKLGDTSVMVTAVSRGRTGPVPNFLPLTVVICTLTTFLFCWLLANLTLEILIGFYSTQHVSCCLKEWWLCPMLQFFTWNFSMNLFVGRLPTEGGRSGTYSNQLFAPRTWSN